MEDSNHNFGASFIQVSVIDVYCLFCIAMRNFELRFCAGNYATSERGNARVSLGTDFIHRAYFNDEILLNVSVCWFNLVFAAVTKMD